MKPVNKFLTALTLCFIVLFVSRPAISARQIASREILPNGITLLHAERKSLPIVTVVVAIKAGSVVEPPGKAGLANLTVELLNEGTKKRSSKDISEEIEFVGGTLDASGGSDYITVTLSVLKKDLALGFDILSDIIINPAFSYDEMERLKSIIKSSIIRQKEEPHEVASKAFLKAVYGDHPYGRPVEGTEETIENITRQDIVNFHSAYYVPNNTIMSVVGDVSSNELKSLIDTYMRGWKKAEIKDPALPDLNFSDKTRVIKIDKKITQSNIIIGHLGIKRDNPDYYAVSVMNYILGGGGSASRLMDNIRENRGLSYDVYSFFSAGKYAGNFQAGLQTKNQTANEAITEILKEMERMRTQPVTDKELEDAKAYLTGSFPLRIDTNSKIAGFLIGVEFFDLGLDYVNGYKKFINSVTKDDILRVSRKYLDPDHYILIVVGDLEKAALTY
ncbi:MAG: pitrilysin family protein [Nitrospirota bacterium]